MRLEILTYIVGYRLMLAIKSSVIELDVRNHIISIDTCDPKDSRLLQEFLVHWTVCGG